jgi:hypothetical protein
MPFFDLLIPIYYLLTFLKNNYKSKNDFNLSINSTQSNGPLSTNQIVSHSISQNDRIQIDYLIMLVGSNQLV